jgi:hypothetical protein
VSRQLLTVLGEEKCDLLGVTARGLGRRHVQEL